jgi:RsiW-degrading membrane proteinase PrsW (M82 family)
MFVLLAFLPALLFVAELRLLDSFKLVRLRVVIMSIAWGGLAALVCFAFHQWLLTRAIVNVSTAAYYVAPATEESLKALIIAVLILRARIGFSVDAAIHGFAVGAGFALVENGIYLWTLPGGSLVLWTVRGFGIAILHGATTAIFAMISRTLADSRRANPIVAFWPGWLAAILIHAMFNRALVSPLAMTVTLLVVMPVLVLIVFHRSERATREWLGAGLDLDLELLQTLRSDAFAETHLGLYLRELRTRFPGPSVVDMFCLLRLETELSIQAKALLMARDVGLELPVDGDLSASLAEISFLHQSIGTTGRLALRPLHVGTRRDRWHRYLLAQRDRRLGRRSAAGTSRRA